ncbi:MAG: NAD(P)/FAD-dependent oxidoreductase [Chthoniobacterales bacterium]
MPDKTRVLVLGGGFGGLYAALHLDKTIARDQEIEVTLVSRENFLLFTPMLPEVAAGDLELTDIVSPLRQMLKHTNVLIAEVESIDPAQRRVTLAYGWNRDQKKILSYDHLLIALGSETSFFNLPGVEESAATMKSLGDAVVLRNQALAMLELASLVEDPVIRRNMLTFVVAGGGFAGVETVGALNDFVREAARYYPNVTEEDVRIVLAHPSAVILPELGEDLGRYAQRKLADRGVEIRTETRVSGYSERGVEFKGGEPIAARILIWTAGVTPHAVLQTLPFKKEKNRIVVDETLEVPGFPGVWAVGDCASVPDTKTGKVQPPTAQHALRQGRHCAKNIVATIRGKPKKPFSFTTLGQLAIIGRRTGVANILGLQFSGLLAWGLWRAIYLMKLPRFEKKLRVALSWTLDLFFPKDLAQHVTLHEVERVQHRLEAARRRPLLPTPRQV